MAAVATAAMFASRRDAAEAAPPIRFVLAARGQRSSPSINYPWPAAISPDGRVVVYSVGQRGTGSMFYALRTDQLEARPIPGTNGAFQPYFSPDGQWLAFQSAAGERKVRLDGSAPVTISEGGSANGADWTINDEIILGATLSFSGLARVSAAGGEPVEFTHPDTVEAANGSTCGRSPCRTENMSCSRSGMVPWRLRNWPIASIEDGRTTRPWDQGNPTSGRPRREAGVRAGRWDGDGCRAWMRLTGVSSAGIPFRSTTRCRSMAAKQREFRCIHVSRGGHGDVARQCPEHS